VEDGRHHHLMVLDINPTGDSFPAALTHVGGECEFYA
jgi:hypothetical protein